MRFLAVAALALAPAVASAEQSPFDRFDVFYRSSNIDISFDLADGDTDGGGMGLRYSNDFGGRAYVFAEYQGADYDTLTDGFFSMEPEATVMRGGVGLHSLGEGAVWYGALSYVKVEIAYPQENSDSGLGLKGGVRKQFSERVAGFVEAGSVWAGDFSGAEYAAGLDFSLGESVGVMLEYAVANLDFDVPDDDVTIENKFTDVRIGLRISL